MNTKYALVFLWVIVPANGMDHKPDYSVLAYNQMLHSRFDHLPIASLNHNLKYNNLEPLAQEYVTHLMATTKKAYTPINKRWGSCYSWPIKPLEEVSWNDIQTYLAAQDGFYNALSASGTPLARY